MDPLKERYRELCEADKTIPLFSQAWWLDAAAGADNWRVALVEKGGQVLATLPFVMKRRFGFTVISQPPLTQTLGPWLRPGNAKQANLLGQQKDLMQALIDQLPEFDHFAQSWHYSRLNWLPFYWRGFRQTTYYTYVLPHISDTKVLWDGLRPNIRTDIRKARDQGRMQLRTDLPVSEFFKLNRMVFKRQRIAMPYREELVQRLDDACSARNARRIFVAQDEEGRCHAAVYLVWDDCSAYYLMGGGDPDLRGSGATSLCMWEAIQFASTVTRRFDFEGSMLEPVERFFRAFGAVQMPYFLVTRTNSKLIKAYHFLRDLRN